MVISKNTQSENQLPLEIASFGDRFFARFVDIIITNIAIRAISLAPILISFNFGEYLYAVYIFVIIQIIILIGYFVVYPYKNNGQTLGKKWNKLRAVNLDGSNLSLGHFFIREFFATLIIYIGAFFIGEYTYLWYLTYLLALTKKKRALHDILAGTQVIKIKNVK